MENLSDNGIEGWTRVLDGMPLMCRYIDHSAIYPHIATLNLESSAILKLTLIIRLVGT